jgi:hypothetical protein
MTCLYVEEAILVVEYASSELHARHLFCLIIVRAISRGRTCLSEQVKRSSIS